MVKLYKNFNISKNHKESIILIGKFNPMATPNINRVFPPNKYNRFDLSRTTMGAGNFVCFFKPSIIAL